MRRNIILILVVVLLLANFVAATETTIKVKTLPYVNVNLNIKESGSNEVFENGRFNANSDQYGDVTFIFSSSVPVFNIGYFVKDDTDMKVASGKLENQDAGGEIYLEAVPDGFQIIETPSLETEENITEEVANETIEESIEEEEILDEVETKKDKKKEDKEKVTALSISDGSLSINIRILYYVLGILVIGGLVFYFLKRKKSPKEIRIKKLSELKKDKAERIDEQEKVIKEAEDKIENARKELKKIRNEDKISELKKKLVEDEKALMKLRRGEDDDDDKDKDSD